MPSKSRAMKAPHVDGKGLWQNWRRSFRRPIDAALDLMDNAVDANLQVGGRIQLQTYPSPKNRQALLLLNSYASEAHKNMDQILSVFSSNKEQDAIGEAGVGLKQASAFLSDFSIVLTKCNKQNVVSFQLGILCRSLQQGTGLGIPVYYLQRNETTSWEKEINDLSKSDRRLKDCLTYLGGRAANFVSIDDDEEENGDEFAMGQKRLVELISLMSDSEDWSNHNYVFCTLLDQLRYGRQELMDTLEEKLPRTYLHMSGVEIYFQQKPISFHFWEQRLVELTCFPIQLSTSVDVFQSVEDGDEDNFAQPSIDATTIRVFVGFDPDRSGPSALHIFSRRRGRLIKEYRDARNELSLNSSGSDYSQGLTIILDDYQGTLPLNPTKQEIACDVVHRDNVFTWLRAVAHTFWKYHYEKLGSKKKSLSDAVKKSLEKRGQIDGDIVPLSESDMFNKFDGIEWYKSSPGRVVTKIQNLTVVKGEATLMRIGKKEEEEEEQGQGEGEVSEEEDQDQGDGEVGEVGEEEDRGKGEDGEEKEDQEEDSPDEGDQVEEKKRKPKKSTPVRRPRGRDEGGLSLNLRRTPTTPTRGRKGNGRPSETPSSGRKRRGAAPTYYKPSKPPTPSPSRKRKATSTPQRTKRSRASPSTTGRTTTPKRTPKRAPRRELDEETSNRVSTPSAKEKNMGKRLKQVQEENQELATKLTKMGKDCEKLRRDVRILERENAQMKKRLQE